MEGYIFGGNNSYLQEGTKVVSYTLGAVPIQATELKGMNHSFRGVIVEGYGDIAGRGVIDLGGNSTEFSADTVLSGNLDFTNMRITAEDTTESIFEIRNRGFTEDYTIDFSGTTFKAPLSVNPILILKVSGSDPSSVTFNNGLWLGNLRCDAGLNLNGLSQKGNYSFTSSESASTNSQAITFVSPFPLNYLPHVTVSDDVGEIGAGNIVETMPVSQTRAGFTSRTYDLNGANFASAVTVNVTWKAEL